MIEEQISIEAQCLMCAMAPSGGRGAALAVEMWVDQHRTAFGHTVQLVRISEARPPLQRLTSGTG